MHLLALLLKVFSQLCLLASSFKSSRSEMEMRDSSRNPFVYKENKACSLVFSQTAKVLLE